jgi:hypothetical protein
LNSIVFKQHTIVLMCRSYTRISAILHFKVAQQKLPQRVVKYCA